MALSRQPSWRFSSQENFHASSLFHLCNTIPEADVFELLTYRQKQFARVLIIEAIMDTDMAFHFTRCAPPTLSVDALCMLPPLPIAQPLSTTLPTSQGRTPQPGSAGGSEQGCDGDR